jgi:preprotein translocase subunit SecG
MIQVILVIHVLLAIALVGSILIQKSEGGALGIGGGGMSGFMTGRSTANLLTRTTAALAVAFFLTSITLAMFADRGHVTHSVVEGPLPSPVERSAPVPAKPAAPTAPSAPLAK